MLSASRSAFAAASARLSGAALGLGLAAVAFGAKGGTELYSSTWVEMALLVVCGAVTAVAILRADPPPTSALLVIGLFALLALATGASIGWSVAPDLSWLELNRTLAYLAVFVAAAIAARAAPGGASVLLCGLVVAAAIVVGYSLLSRVWPAELAAGEIYARIAQPYGYWNAVGLTAALGMPPTLWLAARRAGHAPLNSLAYPVMGLLMVALVLSYSRGALLAGAVGVALWLLLVPLRLRSLAALAIPAAGAAPVVAWALSKDAFTKDYAGLRAREAVAAEFGVLVALMVLVLLVAGLMTGFRVALRAPGVALRRRVGVAAVALAVALPLLGFGSVAVSEPGLGGTVSARLNEATSERATTSGGPARLGQVSSARSTYWREALKIYAQSPTLGTGAGSFGVARLRYRKDQFAAEHAHGQIVQTMSDLGRVGTAITIALVLAWVLGALRPTGPRRRHRQAFPPERIALVSLALVAVIFGVHSAIDWTWFVPGTAVMGLAAAGFVTGRGSLRADAFAAPAAPTPPPAAGDPRLDPTLEGGQSPPPASGAPEGGRARPALAAAVLAASVLCAFAVWQPARSDAHSGRALELIEQRNLRDAARMADRAREINPLTSRPLLVKAAVEASDERHADAHGTLQRAVREHRADPQAWLRLASFQLRQLDRPDHALQTLRGALYLDPRSRAGQALFFEARARQRQRAATAAATGP